MTTLTLSHPSNTLIASTRLRTAWWKRPGAIVSIVLHALIVLALVLLSHNNDMPKPADAPAIQLVLAPPEPPKQLVAPPAPAVPPPQRVQPTPPVKQAPRVARTRTVPTTAAKAQVAAPPEPPSPAPPTAAAPAVQAPMTTAQVATAPQAAPRPRNIGMEGIPSDYVTRVYARINQSAAGHYPRIAKMQQLQGRIVYRLTLAPDGTLLKYEIRTSGESVLDDAAIEAIKAAAPYPKLPDLGGSTYQLSGAIVYRYDD